MPGINSMAMLYAIRPTTLITRVNTAWEKRIQMEAFMAEHMPYFAKALQWVFQMVAAVSVQHLLAK